MKTNQSTLFFAILISLLSSCNHDDLDEAPQNQDIVINDSSVFIQESFIKSFEQIWLPETRWKISFNHEMYNGKVLKSLLNYSIHGNFGKNIFEFTHNYDSLGVITSSNTNVEFNRISEESTFEYTYNEKGFISHHRKIMDAPYTGVDFIYNELGQITDYLDSNYSNGHYMMKYLLDGKIDSYQKEFYYQAANDTVIHNISYTYTDGNMTKLSLISSWPSNLDSESPWIYNYAYDNQNRIIMDEIYLSSFIEYEYLDSTLRSNFFQRGRDMSYLKKISTHTVNHTIIQSIFLYYDYQIKSCKYATSQIGNKRLYYEAIIDLPKRLSDLTLIGYSKYYGDTVGVSEEIYDYKDTLMFYKQEGIWYDFNDREVNIEDIKISASWVKYVSENLK